MQNKRTISIGGATYDLFVQTNSDVVQAVEGQKVFNLPLGEKIRVQNVVETCGGGASNTSVGLARLGCDAKFCGVIADDQWGQKLLENFQKEGVDTKCTTIVEGEVSSFSLILSASNGERTILYEPGTNEHLHDANFNKEALREMDWVYLNHIQENSCIIQDDILEILTQKDAVHFTWNPGGYQIDTGTQEENNNKLLSQTDLLILNKEEAIRFTKQDNVEGAMKHLLKIGVKIVCITDGKNGATASDGKSLYHCPTETNTHVMDTTGAGDAFGTGTTWALIEGMDLPNMLRAGTINAASVVGTLGAQEGLLTNTKMNERLRNSPLEVTAKPLA